MFSSGGATRVRRIQVAAALLVFAIAVAAPAAAAAAEADSLSHIRPLTGSMQRFVAEGLARSPTIRALADELAASDVVVYVRPSPARSVVSTGRLAFVGSAGGQRYVLVEIDCSLTLQTQLATLGHELRHATEVAQAPDIGSPADFAAHYARIGRVSGMEPRHESYETLGAVQAGRQVMREVLTPAGRGAASAPARAR
jgi:hypothetical protein